MVPMHMYIHFLSLVYLEHVLLHVVQVFVCNFQYFCLVGVECDGWLYIMFSSDANEKENYGFGKSVVLKFSFQVIGIELEQFGVVLHLSEQQFEDDSVISSAYEDVQMF